VTLPDRNGAASDDGVRLQKVLAEAGIASRRQAEILMRQGRVEVDGKVVTAMGAASSPTPRPCTSR